MLRAKKLILLYISQFDKCKLKPMRKLKILKKYFNTFKWPSKLSETMLWPYFDPEKLYGIKIARIKDIKNVILGHQ